MPNLPSFLFLRFGWIICLLFFCQTTATAQSATIPEYPFLQQQKNQLCFYGKSEPLFSPFFNQWSKLILRGRERIHVLHMGDSHLQADLFSGRMRYRLQTFLTGLTASRGMVVPFLNGAPDSYSISFAKTWNNTKITERNNPYALSFWGTTVFTNDSSASVQIRINFRNPIPYDFQSVRIYHSPLSPNAYWHCPYIGQEDVRFSAYFEKEGYSLFQFNDYLDTITFVLKQPDSIRGVELYGFYFENQDAGFTYSAVGINGAEVCHYLKMNAKAYDHLSSMDPKLIIISLGTNDAYSRFSAEEFQKNYSTLLTKIRQACPRIPIVLTTPADSWYKKKQLNQRMVAVKKSIEFIAKDYDCAVWDLYSVMGGTGSSLFWQNAGLMQRDRIHFTVSGYQLQGDLLYNALWNAFDSYLDVKNKTPNTRY